MKKISDSTIRRLSKYYRTLALQIDNGVETISSNEIANINSITSAQVRKDLSFFGTFGKRGLGYNTEQLKDQIANILGLKKQWSVGLVGFGNIGRALLRYAEFKKQGFYIKSIFESDSQKYGQVIDGIEINNIDDACQVVKDQNLEIIIVAAPGKYAQAIVDRFIDCGIKAFLNFAPISLKAPEDVLVKNENMSIELEALSFFLYNK
ncbi:MAG: redox-sensing transcriptional repressor Rex [Calditrichaeota bacterium]|nr:MAG: redox-sensing transcriptional repressor Rex [Calditrichota bacterium]MBL1205450.1 redox-sensing transcriptional repressor Rex [Calditrichota bacterium]NOG45279.1 redox-sensing transcriptional repressor Rex [Calditrichota bacterium]